MDLEKLSYVSNFFIPIIAVIAAYFAFVQSNHNREKIKFELFDRRFKIYQSIESILKSLAYGSADLKNEEIY